MLFCALLIPLNFVTNVKYLITKDFEAIPLLLESQILEIIKLFPFRSNSDYSEASFFYNTILLSSPNITRLLQTFICDELTFVVP